MSRRLEAAEADLSFREAALAEAEEELEMAEEDCEELKAELKVAQEELEMADEDLAELKAELKAHEVEAEQSRSVQLAAQAELQQVKSENEQLAAQLAAAQELILSLTAPAPSNPEVVEVLQEAPSEARGGRTRTATLTCCWLEFIQSMPWRIGLLVLSQGAFRDVRIHL